ncbi:unnamed protein product [Symbiodinium microadriaticum]|nr:unnamed protein product [Symbiodinium microadriaticum]
MEDSDQAFGRAASTKSCTSSSSYIDVDDLAGFITPDYRYSGTVTPDYLTRGKSKRSTPSSRSGFVGEASSVPYSKCTWDFFLSHKQSNAQDAVQNLRMAISERMPACSFWLDIEQDPTVPGMCHGVSNSKNFLLFLTQGVTESKFCQMEMRWAMQSDKNIVLVAETDERHGKPVLGELIERCPEDLRNLFEEHVIIPWYRDPDLRSVCVTKILKKCVFEVDAEKASISSKLQRPLMFSNNDELVSLASSEERAVQVIDQSFVVFTSVWGIALPGAGAFVRCWAISVTFLVLACGGLCLSRFLHQTGPTWLDAWTWLQNTVAHLIVFLFLQVVLSVLRSDIILDLLENHIDCSKAQAESLRFRTKVLCAVVWILALLMSGATAWGFVPGFLHPSYIGALGNDLPDHRFFFAIAHTFAYLVVLPIMFGSGLSAVLILLLLQELCFMGFLTSLQRLNPDIGSVGVHHAAAAASPLQVEDGDLTRFKVGFVKTWQLHKKIQRRIALSYVLYWLCHVASLPWSIISLSKGFGPDFSDERLERLQTYSHLQVRVWGNLLLSPAFGIPTYIFALLPWLSVYYHRQFFNLTKQMIFAKTQVEVAFRSFLRDFDLYFSAGGLHATPSSVWIYLLILVLNTLGNVSDKLRVLSAL